MSLASIIPIIISTISTIIALIALFMTKLDMNRRERNDHEIFIDKIFEQFQEQKLAMLQDREALEIMATDMGKNASDLKHEILASIRINQAYRLFRLYQNKYLSEEEWEQFKSDISLLFSFPSIQKRWEEIQPYYQPDFRQLINQKIGGLSSSINTNKMKLKVIHSTTNCEASSCPTIYQNEKGDYVFQGFKLKASVKSQLRIPEKEDVVALPKEFVEGFLRKM